MRIFPRQGLQSEASLCANSAYGLEVTDVTRRWKPTAFPWKIIFSIKATDLLKRRKSPETRGRLSGASAPDKGWWFNSSLPTFWSEKQKLRYFMNLGLLLKEPRGPHLVHSDLIWPWLPSAPHQQSEKHFPRVLRCLQRPRLPLGCKGAASEFPSPQTRQVFVLCG